MPTTPYAGPCLDLFLEVYRQERRRLHRERPDLYASFQIHGNVGTSTIPAANTEAGIERMCDAIRAGTFSKEGPAFVRTCKRLGIRHTYKAIREFVELPGCTCAARTDDDDRPRKPSRVTCGNCGRSWCERCDPFVASAGCHFCHGGGGTSAPLL